MFGTNLLRWAAVDVCCHGGVLVHGQVTIIFVVSVCLSCLFVCLCRLFLSRLRSDLDQRTHVTCPGLVVSPRI